MKVKRKYRKKVKEPEQNNDNREGRPGKGMEMELDKTLTNEEGASTDKTQQKRNKKMKDESKPPKVVRRRKKKDKLPDAEYDVSSEYAPSMPNLSPAVNGEAMVDVEEGVSSAPNINRFLQARPLSPEVIVAPPVLTPMKTQSDTPKSPRATKRSVTTPKSSEKRTSSAKGRNRLSLRSTRNKGSVQTRLTFDKKKSVVQRKVPCIASIRNLGNLAFSFST